MKFWQAVSFTEIEQLVEIAKIVEQTGFDGILVSDHLFFPEKLGSKYPYTPDGVPGFTPDTPWPEPFAAVAAMAAVTQRLRFATMVYILPLRNPLEVAKATATLDVLTGGRFILGSGAGWMKEEFDQLGVDFKTRGARFDESIEVLRALWRPGMVEHRGRFFDVPRLQMSPAPAKPVPIYIGGASPAAFRARRAAAATAGSAPAAIRPRPRATWPSSPRCGARRAASACRSRRSSRSPRRPTPDVLRRLEDQGAHGTVSYPVPVHARSDLDPRREARLPGGLRRERDPQDSGRIVRNPDEESGHGGGRATGPVRRALQARARDLRGVVRERGGARRGPLRVPATGGS